MPLPSATAIPTAAGPPDFSSKPDSDKEPSKPSNGSTNGTTTTSKNDSKNPSSDDTTSTHSPPQTGLEFLTDPSFTPTLNNAPISRYIQSFFILFLVLISVFAGCKFMGFEIFQDKVQQGVVVTAVVMGLFYTGVVWMDFWELVMGYWWVTLPLVGGAGIFHVLMMETAEEIMDVD